MISTFDSCSALPGKLPSGPSSLLTNPFHLREFRIFRRRRLKHCRHAHRRTAFTVRSQSNPFESLFHSLVSQVTSVNSLELIAPALGFSSGVALYLSNVVSPKNSAVSNIGEWILLSSPTPFNRFVFLRCPSIDFSGSDTNLVEDVSDKLMKEDRHFVRLHSGRIKATTGDDALEDKLTYQRLCLSTEDGGVISLDWPSNLNLREEHGLDTTLLLVPGTPEGSMNRNVRLCVIEALARGLFPIVMNPRGCAGSPLTTARLFSAADSDDIYTAVQFISKARPWTALIAIGWGYGANMLTKYLAEVGERTPLTAATCIDNPFDLEEAAQTPPYHMAIDHDLTGGLINILKSNKELFQGKAKGFDVEKALEAKSVREFEKLISRVSLGFNSIEDFYSKSSTRSVVGNVKIPVLYIQNDNGSAPVFSIPRSLIAENPFTSLLLCSYSPSSIISSVQPDLSWCQQLSIEWLTAVELGLLKGRHPLLKDVDITINSSRGLALVDGRTVEERGKVIRQLDYNWSDASSEYQPTSFIKKKLEESHSSNRTHLRSQNDSQRKSQLENKGSLEIVFGVLDQTSSISDDMGKKDEVSSEDIEKGQVVRTAEVALNILDMTYPDTLTEEEKKKVLNAVDKGETLMKALQDAVPEEVRGKLTTALSGILHAQGSNLKVSDLTGTSHKSNATLELKKKTEEKVRHVADAEGSSQVSSPLHEMGVVKDVSDGSDSHQPTKDKFIGELESEPPSSDQNSIDQNGSQPLSIHGDDTISSIRRETSGSGSTVSDDEFSRENASQYFDNGGKELDISGKPEFSSKVEQLGSHEVAIGDNYKDQGGGIAKSDEEEESKRKKNEEKAIDPSIDDKAVSSLTIEEALSSAGSTSETHRVEHEYNNDQMDTNSVQPVVEHTKPLVSESNVNSFSVSQALDALAGIDDSTQLAVNNVFNVIENMISQLEGSENESEDKKTDSLVNNNCSGNDNEKSSGKKECGNMDSSVKPGRLSGPRIINILERRGESEHNVSSEREEEEFTSDLVSINRSYLIRPQSAQVGQDENEKDELIDLDGNVDMTSNAYLDSVHSNFFLKYIASNMPTKPLDKDTTATLLLDYIPEKDQWKFIEHPGNENGAISTSEELEGKVNAYAHAKGKNTDDVIEPLYMILDSDNQPESVGEYQNTVNGNEEIKCSDGQKDLEYFVRSIIQDSLKVEVGRRLSAANKDLKLGVDRDIEHVANLLSVAVGYGSGCRQCLGSKSDSINSIADKMGTLCGEQIIRSISSSVQETVYLKKILPLGVIIGSSLAALRKSFHVTTLHDDNQGECLGVDQAKKSGDRNQNVILTDTVGGEEGCAEMRSLNKDSVVVGAVTAALGASALLVHQQNLCGTDDTTESSFKSKEKASLQKEPERHDEQIIPEKNHNIVTALAEKAMSVASPVVPKKEDGEVDEERLVNMLAELGEKGGILKLVGRIALLWGGIRTAMSVTEKLISILRIAERPLFQRILGSVGLVLILWSPITLPLLPKLVDSWTSHTPSKIANLACGFGLYIALAILVMMWGKRIRGYEDPAKEYGLDLASWFKSYDFLMAFFGGVAGLLGIQCVNGFLGYTTLSLPAIPTLVNWVSWLKVLGGSLLLVSVGVISSIFVTAVEEFLFRSWLTEEIALDLGYYPGIIISGLAFAILQRSLQAIPVLWVLSLGLAGARQRRDGCLSIPIGLRAGITASSFIFLKGGFISYKPSIPTHHSLWIMGIDTHQPLSGVAGFAFALLVACIFFPRNPMKKNLRRTIRE
ncbi:uncharacterized protein LOC111439764 isoform X1 [Cucurbita moschata]|uniref:Uncharacterized protein LOC111439764 isoform X1 n=2 Tax=Cucurbita moschata TaxID=3662 RepID=A0A6J1EYN6_CUCMO|nr:uncharacterized protein LOC111439764 isoform X1 [Cucurbita moschata]